MRKEIYQSIVATLLERVPSIQHIDLWNRNVEFIEQEEAWPRPAVFVEFAAVDWQPTVGRQYYTTKGTVLLHVVTDWKGSASAGSPFMAESLAVFDLLNEIHMALRGLEDPPHFYHLELTGSRTNHDHEDLLENVEIYGYRGGRIIEN